MVVAGGTVGAHRDPAPLLEFVEAAFDDVAAVVAGGLGVTKSMGRPRFMRRCAI